MKMNNLTAFLATALMLSLASCASASTVSLGGGTTLDQLLMGSTIEVGGKVFADFSYLAGGDMPAAADINVDRIVDCDGNFGIRFQGGFVDLPLGGASDALITYSVTAVPGMEISDAHMSANLDVVGGGLGIITESFIPDSNMTMSVFDNGVDQQLTAWINPFVDGAGNVVTFDRLNVQKDILLLADDAGIATVFSFVDQTFSMVPEPNALILLAIGLLGMIRRR